MEAFEPAYRLGPVSYTHLITLRNEPPVDEVTATVLFHTADEVMTVGNDSLQVVEKSEMCIRDRKATKFLREDLKEVLFCLLFLLR